MGYDGLFYALIAVIFGLEAAGRAAAECCIRTKLEYDAYDNIINNLGKRLGPKAFCNFALQKPRDLYERGHCKDGLLTKDRFCGRGECNFFGCGCDGGCLDESDAAEIKRANCTLIDELREEILRRFEYCTENSVPWWRFWSVSYHNHCENSIPPRHLSRIMG